MKKPSDNRPADADSAMARLMGLGERSVRKSYYPQLQEKIRELEKSEQRYRLLAENISDVIWMLTPDFTIAYISPSVHRMSGFFSRELTGTSFLDLLEPDQAQSFTDLIQATLADAACPGPAPSGARQLELALRTKEGSFIWTEARVSCLSQDQADQARILGVSRDITERRQAQKEKEEMQRLLAHAQKMESIGTLAGGIAHDFNNLLTVINGYAGLVRRRLLPGDPLETKVQAIAHAGKRAEELTRQLLAFSRKQIFSPRILDINTTVTAMDKMLRRLIGEDILVKTHLEEGLGPISADQTQVEQIFTNLVVNARDALNAVERKGFQKRLTIETGQRKMDRQTAQMLELPCPGDYLIFSVSDNGQGMDPETQKRIFEPFFTTKSKHKGTGLGLAMVYGIVKQNQGAIKVYSEPGQGSTFKVYWPLAARETQPAPPAPTVGHRQDLSGKETILLVEDDPEVLSFAASALAALGYGILRAPNGRVALDLLAKRRQDQAPLPDLVVTDLIMPEMNGKDFVEKALALAPNLPVIYVSGHTDKHIVQNGLLESGVHFIQKPYSQGALAKMIRKVLADQTLL